MNAESRRKFLARASAAAGAVALARIGISSNATGQELGDRPEPPGGIKVLNPRGRVPVGLIIDDSTCLVNLNRFAMPQFDQAHGGKAAVYRRNWKEWPIEIPDAFVRKFGEWCADQGVKGKYSIVPYPACVGRLDRLLPGWTQRELDASLDLVRTVMMPNWDIHPEMVTHTRVIDTRTGHPYPEVTPKYMENWEWTTGKSVEEMTDYLAYALRILKNVDLPCEGITTPGGFGNRARPQLAQGTFNAVREVFGAEIPHYFRDLYDEGTRSVAPIVQYARDLDTSDPKCVVSILGCTGDWTGGWDNTPPEGPDRFITPDLARGRMVDVIERGEPAFMVCHWTGIYWNGQELGFKVFQEVVRRLKSRFNNLRWMKLSEVARYWAAKELTRITRDGNTVELRAPFACPDFTLQVDAPEGAKPTLRAGSQTLELREVDDPLKLEPGTWMGRGGQLSICHALSKGVSTLRVG